MTIQLHLHNMNNNTRSFHLIPTNSRKSTLLVQGQVSKCNLNAYNIIRPFRTIAFSEPSHELNQQVQGLVQNYYNNLIFYNKLQKFCAKPSKCRSSGVQDKSLPSRQLPLPVPLTEMRGHETFTRKNPQVTYMHNIYAHT